MQLTDKIHLLKIDFEIALSPEKKLSRFVNSFIIFGEKITLIDTGVKGSEEKIFEYIRQNNRDVYEIETVILSHSHPDHIGSANAIKKITGCRVLAHENEKSWIEDIDLQNRERPVPGFYNLADQPVKIDEYLVSGRRINAGQNITMEIIHSPGHSKGSVNILFREDRILFTADSIPLKNDIPNYDNFSDLVNSLKAIKTNNQYDILLTSWTPPITTEAEIRTLTDDGEKYILKINETVKAVYSGTEPEPLAFCRKSLQILGLPLHLTNPVVDRAFKSHLHASA